MSHTLPLFLLLASLAGCAGRGQVSMGPETAALAAGAHLQTIFVATDRGYEGGPEVYGRNRTETPGFARFTVAVPPDRTPGSIGWPHRAPDFKTDFVTVAGERMGQDDFFSEIDTALAALPPGSREVVIFVHGFNTNYPEAFYRQAQMMQDFGVKGVGVTFAWASAGNPFGYVHDRDSALFARNALGRLFEKLERSRAERVIVIAHSMGGLLSVETLRAMALRGTAPPWGKLQGVFLLSPDIAVDVFRTQAQDIGTLPQPFVIFTSDNDRALALAAGISGQRDRLGSLPDAQPISDLDVTVIDLTEIGGGDPSHHMTAVTSPASVAILSQAREFSKSLEAEQIARRGLLPGTVIRIGNATEVVLNPGDAR